MNRTVFRDVEALTDEGLQRILQAARKLDRVIVTSTDDGTLLDAWMRLRDVGNPQDFSTCWLPAYNVLVVLGPEASGLFPNSWVEAELAKTNPKTP